MIFGYLHTLKCVRMVFKCQAMRHSCQIRIWVTHIPFHHSTNPWTQCRHINIHGYVYRTSAAVLSITEVMREISKNIHACSYHHHAEKPIKLIIESMSSVKLNHIYNSNELWLAMRIYDSMLVNYTIDFETDEYTLFITDAMCEFQCTLNL